MPRKKTAPLELNTKTKKRKIAAIYIAVQGKLASLMAKQIQGVGSAEVRAALADTQVRQAMQKHLLAENIKLVNAKSQKPVFQRQLSLLGEKGDQAVNDSPVGGYQDTVDPEATELRVDNKALADVREQVKNAIRRNSKLVE